MCILLIAILTYFFSEKKNRNSILLVIWHFGSNMAALTLKQLLLVVENIKLVIISYHSSGENKHLG